MDFAEQEALDGLRFTWNAWPSSRIEAARLVSVDAGCSCLNLRVSVILIPHECLQLTVIKCQRRCWGHSCCHVRCRNMRHPD